ncbi:MAG: type III PLP-dependent enzyme [Chloroflexi bacterium]|nr:type III PLP-dependent enzyme [Chloroflexota bacterium]
MQTITDALELRLTEELLGRSRLLPTPHLMVDRRIVRANYRRLLGALAPCTVSYAVKANPDPGILATLAVEGCDFEVASEAEMRLALDAGAAPGRITSSNPVKPPSFVAAARAVGVRAFAIDSPAEVEKIAHHAPGSDVYVRIAVDNSESAWPLSRKHGADPNEAIALLGGAARQGLHPIGVTFHVGSQCLSPHAWRGALLHCARIWDEAERHGIALSLLNIGGGFPVRHLTQVPEAEEIGQVVRHHIRELFPADIRVAAEPGRGLVGSAGVLVAEVIGLADRGDERWAFLDAGVFNGLMETIGGIRYEFLTERTAESRIVTLAGPSCDSVDTIQTGVPMPEVEIGDRVYVMATGAYTLSYASEFNGFARPTVAYVDP